MNIPNTLTWSRIILIPFFLVIFYLPFHYARLIAAFLFLLAAITDWLDGFLARQLKQTSAFGAFLDPVADKLMVATALILLVSQYPTPWMVVPGIVIVCREIVISALREWMAEIGERAVVKVSAIGKIKTVVQMIALLILISQPTGVNSLIMIGLVLMYAAVVLTLWSMLIYLGAAWKVLHHTNHL
ncbi:MAG: CDP-diacylglycerol--glycerol-3-phosphate 3-phosphatidyltransferase [Gammaproteobacteria bacterium]|nr:CDP-diacylglycerol--glycerol-3-phosphate 3-phosphatidyltransferase [Gammaproteobacteria bacterium]